MPFLILVKVSKFQRVQTKIFLGVIKEKPSHSAGIGLKVSTGFIGGIFFGHHAHTINHSTEHDKHNINNLKRTQVQILT